MELKPNHALILTLFLIAAFVAGFVWYLHRRCLRVVQDEALFLELAQHQGAQEQKETAKGVGVGKAGA